MDDNTFVFKRRMDGVLYLGWIVVGFILLITLSMALSILSSAEKSNPIFYILTVLYLFISIIIIKALISAKSTIITVDSTKIVTKDRFGAKEVLWSDILNVVHYTHTTNGILKTEMLNFMGQGDKVLYCAPYHTNKYYSDSGDLADVLLSIYEGRSLKITTQIKEKEVLDPVSIYKIGTFYKLFFSIIPLFLFLMLFVEVYAAEGIFGKILTIGFFLVLIYLAVVHITSRFELNENELKYRNIFKKYTIIPVKSIKQIENRKSFFNHLSLNVAGQGMVTFRYLGLLNVDELANEISLRTKIANETK